MPAKQAGEGGRTMETTQVQKALLDLVQSANAAQRAWLADLTDAERNAVGTPEQWSPKDILAHIVFWEQVSAERLEATRRGEQPQTFEDFQIVNERIFEERRNQPWELLIGASEQVYAILAD